MCFKRKKKNHDAQLKKRQLTILDRYFPVDREKKRIKLNLYYEKASDLLDYSIGEEGHEMFKDEFIDKLYSLLSKVPYDYTADINLDIRNYDVADEASIRDKFNDILAIDSFEGIRNKKINALKGSFLILIGFVLIIINAIFSGFNIFGKPGEIRAQIFTEFLQIVSWVFVWEAVHVMFLEPSETSLKINHIYNKTMSLTICNNGKPVLYEDDKQMFEESELEGPTQRARRNWTIITATVFAFIAIQFIVDFIVAGVIKKEPGYLTPTTIGVMVPYIVILTISSIIGFEKYLGRKDRDIAWRICFFTSFCFVIGTFILTINASLSGAAIFNEVLLILVFIMNFVVYFSHLIAKRKHKKIN